MQWNETPTLFILIIVLVPSNSATRTKLNETNTTSTDIVGQGIKWNEAKKLSTQKEQRKGVENRERN